MNKHHYEIIGLIGFIIAGVIFVWAGARAGDMLTVLGSIIWIVSCLIWIVPLLKSIDE